MLLAAVALLAACGDSKKPAAGPQLSHADYVRQADAACQRADAALASLPQPAGVAQLPSYAKQASDIVAAERQETRAPDCVARGGEERRALHPPAADRARADELGAAMDEVAKAAEGLIAVAG